MKKIVLNYIYLSKNHAGGKDQVGINLLKGFFENGFAKNMHIICFDYSKGLIQAIAPDINIISIKSKKFKTEFARMAYLCYVNTFVVSQIVEKYNFDLIFHLNCNTGLKKLNVTSVVLPHDIKAISHRVLANIKVPWYKYILYRVLYYFDFKNNDKIIAISENDKAEIIKHYSKYANKVYRIYNPIDIKPSFSPERKATKDIIAINLQFHHKNILTLIKAFEKIKDDIDANLVLVGSLPRRMNYLHDYVQKHCLDSRVMFTGFIPEEQKRGLLLSSRLYVNPTLYEGFGMTAVEAIILRVPTLLSKIPQNYEVTQGLCEYYYPPEDIDNLAEKLVENYNREFDDLELTSASETMYKAYNYSDISKQYYTFLNSI